jgi:hypothetical protein
MHAISATLLVASVLFSETPAAATARATASPNGLTTRDSLIAATTATPAAVRSSADDARVANDFAPSSDPPWNPPKPMGRRRAWEQAILLPQRVVTYPLSMLGAGTDWALGKFEKTNYFAKLGALDDPPARRALVVYPPKRLGFEVGPARLGDNTGLGGRFQVHAPVFSGQWRSLAFVEHSPSTRNYHETRLGLSGDLGAIEYDYDWRPEDRFYGIGMTSSVNGISNFATQYDQVRVTLQYAWNRDRTNSRPRTNVAIFAGPRSAVTKSGREPGTPSIEDVYPDLVATTFQQRHDHFIYGGRFATDWRSGIPHLASGWRALVQSERFDEPHGAIGLHTNHGAGAQFTRTQVELEGAWSIMRDPRTIRVMGRIVDVGVSNGLERMEEIDLSKLGGSRAGLAGFSAGRFHDLDAVYGRLMYIFPLVRRLELELHTETGEVTSDVWRNSRFDKLAFSSGFAFRARSHVRPIGRIGMDFSDEGVVIHYSIGGGE